MPETKTLEETRLQLQQTFPVRRDRVFQAWTRPDELRQWCAPSDEYSVVIAEVDLRVGGRYRIGMKDPDGTLHVATGTYREIKPSEKLVYTWTWEDGEMGETLVTVEFRDHGSSTEVVLTHELFPDPKTRDDHRRGWSGCLARLARVV